MNDISVLNLFLEAGMVVKIVMLLLFIASILSWIVIVERFNFFRKIKSDNDNFLKTFWSGKDLDILYKEVSKESSLYGAKNLFKNSFDEFSAINLEDNISEFDLESINRSMRVSIASDEEEMNKEADENEQTSERRERLIRSLLKQKTLLEKTIEREEQRERIQARFGN